MLDQTLITSISCTFTFHHFTDITCFIFEPTCAYAQWALVHRFMSETRYLTKIHWTIIHISPSMVARVMKFGTGMYVNALWVDLEGQGQRSRSRGQKNVIFGHFA